MAQHGPVWPCGPSSCANHWAVLSWQWEGNRSIDIYCIREPPNHSDTAIYNLMRLILILFVWMILDICRILLCNVFAWLWLPEHSFADTDSVGWYLLILAQRSQEHEVYLVISAGGQIWWNLADRRIAAWDFSLGSWTTAKPYRNLRSWLMNHPIYLNIL